MRRWCKGVVIFLQLGFALPVLAVSISDIEVRQTGIGKSDPDFVLAHTRVKPGQEFNSSAVSRDVKLLLDTKQFSKVDAFVEETGDGITLIYSVQPKMRLAKEPTIRGNREFRTSRIRKWIGLEQGMLVDDQIVGVAVRKVLDEYRDEAYGNATCSWEFSAVDEDTGIVELVITIDEGDIAYIKGVRLQGNEHVSASDLRKAVLRPSVFNPIRWIWRKHYKHYELNDIKTNVEKVYMDRGFLDVQVSVSVDDSHAVKHIADVEINEGIQYHLDGIGLDGISIFPETELIRLVFLQSGQIASMSAVNKAADRIQAYYGDRGYLNAGARPVLTPDAEQGTVDLAIVVYEGEQVSVRNILIRGNTRTRDKVIRRELLVYPGEVYNQTRVKRSERRIQNLGFFETARVIPRETSDPAMRDLVFDVSEKRTGQFMLGAGFSSVDKLIGFVELSQANFDIANWPTFTGGGQKLRIRAQFGSRRKDYELSITEPWFMNRRLSLGFNIYRRDRDYTDYDVERTGASITLGKALPGPNRIRLQYSIEESVITDVTDTNVYYVLDSYDFEKNTGVPYQFESEQDRIKSTLTATLIHDTRNNPFVPTRGNKASLFYSVSGGPMGFDTDIYDLGLKTTSYFPLWFGHVFNVRTQLEFVEAFGDTDVVPLSDKLFLGGGRSLRGFNYRDVGPKVIRPISDGTGYYDRSFGGQSLLMANIEYTVPIVQGIRLGTFYDIGNVWADSYKVNLGDLASSVGLGLRFDMPGFPIRIDRAWAIDKDDDFTQEDNWVIWIGYDY